MTQVRLDSIAGNFCLISAMIGQARLHKDGAEIGELY